MNSTSLAVLTRDALGIDLSSLAVAQEVDVSDQGVEVLSYKEGEGKVFRRVNKLFRKEDARAITLSSKDFSFTGSGEHRVASHIEGHPKWNYWSLEELLLMKKPFTVLLESEDWGEGRVIDTKNTIPIFDIEVDETRCYFTGGILSHNSWAPAGQEATTTGGGKALKFYTSVRFEVKRVATLENKESPYGISSSIKCVKNKVGRPFRKIVVDNIWGKGFDIDSEFFPYLREWGVITGQGWYHFDVPAASGPGEEHIKINGEDKVQAWFKEHPDHLDYLKKKLFARMSTPAEEFEIAEPETGEMSEDEEGETESEETGADPFADLPMPTPDNPSIMAGSAPAPVRVRVKLEPVVAEIVPKAVTPASDSESVERLTTEQKDELLSLAGKASEITGIPLEEVNTILKDAVEILEPKPAGEEIAPFSSEERSLIAAGLRVPVGTIFPETVDSVEPVPVEDPAPTPEQEELGEQVDQTELIDDEPLPEAPADPAPPITSTEMTEEERKEEAKREKARQRVRDRRARLKLEGKGEIIADELPEE